MKTKTKYELTAINLYSLIISGFMIGGSLIMIIYGEKNIDELLVPCLNTFGGICIAVGIIKSTKKSKIG